MTTRMGRIAFALVLMAAAVSSGACSPTTVSCTANLVGSFIVHVEDATTAAAICDATVTANDGSQTWTLETFGGPPDCSYGGVYEQAGTFHIAVSKAGYQQAETTVVVKSNRCHVITRNVTVKLSPQ